MNGSKKLMGIIKFVFSVFFLTGIAAANHNVHAIRVQNATDIELIAKQSTSGSMLLWNSNEPSDYNGKSKRLDLKIANGILNSNTVQASDHRVFSKSKTMHSGVMPYAETVMGNFSENLLSDIMDPYVKKTFVIYTESKRDNNNHSLNQLTLSLDVPGSDSSSSACVIHCQKNKSSILDCKTQYDKHGMYRCDVMRDFDNINVQIEGKKRTLRSNIKDKNYNIQTPKIIVYQTKKQGGSFLNTSGAHGYRSNSISPSEPIYSQPWGVGSKRNGVLLRQQAIDV